MESLLKKIEAREATIAVLGLGYVGLPLVVDFAASGFAVCGIDVDHEKVELLNSGESYVADVPSERLRELAGDRLRFTTEYEALQDCDAVLICVPTPLNKTRDPDVHFLIEAAEGISQQLRVGMLVSLESTTYPGTTSELLKPILERGGLKAGKDFFLAFSPERIDPGRSDIPLAEIPKVVGGSTPECSEVAQRLYGTVMTRVVPVSSAEAAEMVKLLENTFRAVNIALVNETAIMCDKMGIDVWEVVEAAATKPFGYMKFTPGPGVGGHCIPLDPHYLSWKLKTLNYNARFVQLAGEINTFMPVYWANKVQDALNESGKSVKGSRVLVIGVAYKRDVDDVRESPALDIIELLHLKGADVRYYDPYVDQISEDDLTLSSEADLEPALETSDCVVIVTDHSCFDWRLVKEKAAVVVDTRNVLEQQKRPTESAPVIS